MARRVMYEAHALLLHIPTLLCGFELETTHNTLHVVILANSRIEFPGTILKKGVAELSATPIRSQAAGAISPLNASSKFAMI